MANIFDQFDAPAQAGGAAAAPNIFDQFDAKPATPEAQPQVDDYGRAVGPNAPDVQVGQVLGKVYKTAGSLHEMLAPAPNTEYGDILPIARDTTTGALRPALPNIIRAPLYGATEPITEAATFNPATGTFGVTPEVSAAVQAFGNVPTGFSRPLRSLSRAERDVNASGAPVADIMGATSVDQAIEHADAMIEGTAPEAPAAAESTGAMPVPEAAPTAAPTTAAEARAVASAYYRQAEVLGGDLTQDFTNRFIASAEKIAPQTEEGRIVTGDTAVTSLVDRMQGLRDRPLSLQAAQEIDEALGSLIDKEYSVTGMSKEGKHLLDLQTTLRTMIADAGEGDVSGGTQGFESLALARQAWSQAAKMGDVERILNRAALTDNPATSIKSGIRVLLSNPSRARGYSAVEIDALKDAANRGAIGGMLHVFGSRLTPLITGGIGLTHGPFGAMAAAGVTHLAGTGARALATGIQNRRAQNALSVIGEGVPANPERLINAP